MALRPGPALAALASLWAQLGSAQLVVAGAASAVQASQPASSTSGSRTGINLLQWNMHGECFLQCTNSSDRHCDSNYPACKQGATAFLKELITGQAPPDFAGIEQLNEQGFLAAGLDPARWGRFTQVCGGENGFGVWPFDSATLYFDKTKWSPVAVPGVTPGGCMELVTEHHQSDYEVYVSNVLAQARGSAANNYRAYMVQAFRHTSSGEQVVVAVSHNPHVVAYQVEIAALKDTVALIQAQTGITELILIADTNVNRPGSPFYGGGRTSQSVMEDIYPGAGSTVVSTDLRETCCAWTYVHTFDRIIAAGFQGRNASMTTGLPFQPNRPPWVALNMHDPITGRLELAAPATALVEKAAAKPPILARARLAEGVASNIVVNGENIVVNIVRD